MLVALAGAAASVRRFAWAVAPMALDADVLLEGLAGTSSPTVLNALADALGADARFAWERELLDAFRARDVAERQALVNEQLTELDGRAQRWARVPRVCASVSTSAGFLCGLLALMRALSVAGADGGAGLHVALGSALASLTIGMAGTSFCIAVHVRAARMIRA